MRHFGQEFWSILRKLKREVPTRRRLRIQTTKTHVLEKHWGTPVFGDCSLKAGGSVIRIDASLETSVAVETLIHEYAHHVARTSDHGKAWERAYGRCYRAIYPTTPA